jgi:hypothetical protein
MAKKIWGLIGTGGVKPLSVGRAERSLTIGGEAHHVRAAIFDYCTGAYKRMIAVAGLPPNPFFCSLWLPTMTCVFDILHGRASVPVFGVYWLHRAMPTGLSTGQIREA